MVKSFQESFDNLLRKDSKTTAFWNITDGVLQGGLATLGLVKRVPSSVVTNIGPCIFDSKREYIYFIKYNQDPTPHISVGIFDIKRKRFKADIVLNSQDFINDIVLDPVQDTLFLISTNSNLLRRINLNTLSEIQNPVSIPKLKKIVFHKGLNKVWFAGDTLYEATISDLVSSPTLSLTNIPHDEVLDISLGDNHKDLVFITRQKIGAVSTYKINHIDLNTNLDTFQVLFSGNSSSSNSIIPTKIIAKDSGFFVLNNSLINPGFTRFSTDLLTRTDKVVALTNISQDSIKDLHVKNDNLYISQSDTVANTQLNQNNVVYIYDLNTNNLANTIVLPGGSTSGHLTELNNELFIFPTNIGKINRIDLTNNSNLQEINLNNSGVTNFSKPVTFKNYLASVDFNSSSNGLFIFENTPIDVNFGKGTKALILDGNNANSCTLDGIVIPGGPFNLLNPFIFDETEYESVVLQNNAVGTYGEQVDYFTLRCSKSILIDTSSKIIANGLGDFGGKSGITDELAIIKAVSSAGQGLGSGKPGVQLSPISATGGSGGSGAGHSDQGSNSTNIVGGRIFGDKLFEFHEVGSGGGAGAPKTGEAFSIGGHGGRGGGAIALISPYISLNGSVEAEGLDGEIGVNYGGGGGAGSGGSIFLQAINLVGAGILNVSGGLGGESLANPNSNLGVTLVEGGDGASGRIRIDALNDTSAFITTGEVFKTIPFYKAHTEAVSTIFDTEETAPVNFLNVTIGNSNFKQTAREEFKIAVSTTTLTISTYTTNNNELLVFKNGLYQLKNTDYTEDSSNSISFTNPLSAGDRVSVINAHDSDILFDNSLGTITQTPVISGNSLLLSQPYMVDTNTIFIFKNGSLLPSSEYIEINHKLIDLSDTPNVTDVFLVLSFNQERFKTKTFTISSLTTSLAFDYLPGSDRLLVFKNGSLLSKDSYKESLGQVKFNQTLVNGDSIVLGEIKLTNSSLQLADGSTTTELFQFNKFDIKDLNQRFFKWKIIFEPSKTLSPIISDLNFEVADSVSKPYISLDLKNRSIEERDSFQVEWSTFNVSNLKLTAIPEDLSGIDVLSNTEINLASSIGSLTFPSNKNTVFILSGDSAFGPVERRVKGYANSDSVLSNALVLKEEVSLTTGEDTATFSNPAIPQSNDLLVFQNGVLIDSNNYSVSSSSIILNTPVSSDSIITAWAFPEDFVKVETAPATSTVVFTYSLDNSIIFNNGKLLNRESDYTVNGNIVEFDSFDSGSYTVIHFNPTLVVVNEVTKYSTNIFQKDIVTKKTSFSINENCIQLYKNGLLVNTADLTEDEAFALTIKDNPTKKDIFSLVSFNIINNHLLNNPTPPVLDEEIAVTTALQSSPGFIRQDVNFGDNCSGTAVDLILGREEKISNLNQTVFNITSFDYTPGDKTLVVYVNGLLQVIGDDYLESSNTSITFTQSLPLGVRVSLLKLDSSLIEREDISTIPSGTSIINFSSLTYATHKKELLVFRNGILNKTNLDFSETLSTAITLSLPTVNNFEKIIGFNIPSLSLEIQSISGSAIISSSIDFNFTTSQDKILVFRNGQLQILNIDYTITGDNEITFTNVLVSDNDTISLVNSVIIIPAPTQKVILTREDQSFSGSATFTIQSFIYTPGASELLVYVNGILQNSNNYTEDSTNSVTILSSLNTGDNVSFIRILSGILKREDLLSLSTGSTLCTFSTISNSDLIVYRDGLLKRIVDDYTNSGVHSIIVDPAIESGDYITGLSIFGYNFETIIAGPTATITTNFDFNFLDDINTVLVHKNGQLQEPNSDYSALDTNIISFNTLAEGDIIHIISDTAQLPCNIDEDGNPFVSLKNIPLPVQSKSLIFQNGLLLTEVVDYSKISDTQYTLLDPLNDPSLISIINNHSLERKDIEVTDYNIMVYSPVFTGTLNSNILVFRNGELLNQNYDYTNVEGVITFLPGILLENGDNLSFIKFNVSTLIIEARSPIGTNVNLPINSPFRSGYDELLIFRNGQLLEATQDYVESAPNLITLNFTPKTTDIFSTIIVRNVTQKTLRNSISLNSLDTDISFSTPFEFSTQNILVFVRPKVDNSVFKLIEYGTDYTEKENLLTIPGINKGDEVSVINFQQEMIVTKEKYTPSSGDTTVIFQTFTHSPNQQKLLVFKNGDLLELEIDYIEVDSRRIQFTNPLSNTDKIQLIHLSTNTFQMNYESRVLDSLISNYTLDNFSINNTSLVFQDRNLLSLNQDYFISNPYKVNFTNPISSGTRITFIKPLSGSQEVILGTNSTIVSFNILSYTPGNKEILVFKNGLFQSLDTDYTETSPNSITFSSVVSNTDYVQVIKCKTANRQKFNISSTTQSIQTNDILSTQFSVFKNGQLQFINIDYTQTSNQEIVFAVALTSGDVIELVDITDPTVLLSASFKEEDYINNISGQVAFVLHNFTYTLGNKSLLLFKNGNLLKIKKDYKENDLKDFTLNDGVITSDKVKALGFFVTREAAVPVVTIKNFSYEVEQNELLIFIDGSFISPNIQYEEISSTELDFNLSVRELLFLNGVLQARRFDYKKTGVRDFLFNTNPILGDQIDVIYAKLSGNIVNVQEVVDSSTLYNLTDAYTVGSSGLLVFINGILQQNTVDYTETSPTSVQFISPLEIGDILQFIYLNKITDYDFTEIAAVDNQSLFSPGFSYTTDKVLVFSNGILQRKGLDYIESSSTEIIFISPRMLGDLVTFINIKTPNYIRDIADPVENNSLVSLNTTIPFLKESSINANTKITIFKVEKDFIHRTDIYPAASTRLLDVLISVPRNNVVVFKNGNILRQELDYTISNNKVVLATTATSSDQLSLIQFTDGLVIEYEEVNLASKDAEVRFNKPFRSNTFDYWIFQNGKFLTKDLFYTETSLNSILLKNTVIQTGDLISKINFKFNENITSSPLSFNHVVAQDEKIYADDYSSLINRANIIAQAYGVKPVKTLSEVNSDDKIIGDDTLSIKNILKLANERENSNSDFTLVDNRIFEDKSYTASLANNFKDIINETLLAKPNVVNPCLSAMEGNFPVLRGPGLRAATLSFLTDNPTILAREEQISTSGQVIVSINTFTYTLGQNNLMVLVNGILQTSSFDYNETDNSTITFLNPLSAGDQITLIKTDVLKFKREDFINPTVSSSNITFATITHTSGDNELHFFRNGLLQSITSDYTETSNNSVSASPIFIANEVVNGILTIDLQYESFTIGSNQHQIVSDTFDLRVLGSKALIFRNGQLQIGGQDYSTSGKKTLIDSSNKWNTGDIITILGDKIVKKVFTASYPYYDSILDSDFNTSSLQYFENVEEIVTSSGQTQIILTNFIYTPNTKQILVFKNNEILNPGVDFTEIGTDRFNLSSPANSGDIIKVIRLDITLSNQDLQSNFPVNTTSIFINSALSNTLSLIVFKNGSLLTETDDYTITSAQSYDLATPVGPSDIIFNLLLNNANIEKFNVSTGTQSRFITELIRVTAPTLLVFKNGDLVNSTDYSIIDSQTIEFNAAVSSPAVIELIAPQPDFSNLEADELDLRLISESSKLSLTRESQNVAVTGQTVFGIKTFEYKLGANNLQVFVNGIMQIRGVDYKEINPNTIKFEIIGLQKQDHVDFVLLERNGLITADVLTPVAGNNQVDTTIPFIPNNQEILVWRNGILQDSGVDFTESLNSLTFNTIFGPGETVKILYLNTDFTYSIQTITGDSDVISLNQPIILSGLQLQVYKNGLLQIPGFHYMETADNQIQFISGNLEMNDKVTLITINFNEPQYHIGSLRDVRIGACLETGMSKILDNTVYSTFDSSKRFIKPGEDVILEWSTENADTASLSGIGTVDVNGKVIVRPFITTVYTLTASNNQNEVTKTIIVKVIEPPSGSFSSTLSLLSTSDPQVTLTASSNNIVSGDTVSLIYSAENVIGLEIDNGIGSVPIPSGSIDVTPNQSTIYNITATGINNQIVYAAVPIFVQNLPEINFTASKTVIKQGESTNLEWELLNTDSFTIDNGVVTSNQSNGSTTVSPTSTTTYTLTAVNSVGSSNKTITITVNPPTPDIIFSASKTTINPGQSTKLSWNVSNSDSRNISGIGSIDPIDYRIITPTETTTYLLTADNTYGTSIESITINVQPGPKINFFGSSNSEVLVGEEVTLSWSTSDTATTFISPDIGTVPVNGTKKVKITQETTTFTLTAGNNTAGQTTKEITIKAKSRPTIDYFSASSDFVFANDMVTLKWATRNSTKVTINNGIGEVPIVGEKQISLNNNKTYILTAENEHSVITQVLKVAVAPKIYVFLAEKTEAQYGEQVRIIWQVIGADKVEISGIGPVSKTGSRKITVLQTTLVKITATNGVSSESKELLIKLIE